MLNCRLPHWCLQRTRRVFFVDTAWGLATTISSVFAACKLLQWDLQGLLLLYPWEENLMQKDLMILHKLSAPFALKVGTAVPFSAQWRTHNIAMLITGHHDNWQWNPETRDNVPAVNINYRRSNHTAPWGCHRQSFLIIEDIWRPNVVRRCQEQIDINSWSIFILTAIRVFWLA